MEKLPEKRKESIIVPIFKKGDKIDYAWISDRIIETRIKVLNRSVTIVGVYAPIEGKEQDRRILQGTSTKDGQNS